MTDNHNGTHSRKWLFWLTVGILFLIFIYLIRGVLLPFVLGIFIAYFFHPIADRLEKMGASRTLATLSIIVTFFVILATIVITVVPIISDQLSGLVAALPDYISALQDKYGAKASNWLIALPTEQMVAVKNAAANLSGMVLKIGGEFVTDIFHSGLALLTLLSMVLITPVVAFYLLRDWSKLIARIDRLLPREHAKTIRQQCRIIDRTLAGFVRGEITVCLVMATYYATALSFAGLKFGIVIGIMTGLLVIVPYVGFLFGAAVGLAAALFQFDDFGSIFTVLLLFLAGAGMEGYVITPKLVGEKVGLHPVWMIFGLLAGAALFGLVGAFLAVPVTAVIGVLIRFALDRYLESDYYRGDA